MPEVNKWVTAVNIITNASAATLQTAVNTWITTTGPALATGQNAASTPNGGFMVNSLTYSSAATGEANTFSCCIFYTVLVLNS